MRNHTIWESSNRPLLVKSVWRESCGGYRHFILDFDSQRKFRDLNLNPRREILKPILYSEQNRQHEVNLQLVGSVKPQSRPSQGIRIPKPTSNNRKSGNSAPKSFLEFLRKRGAAVREDLSSKKNSINDCPTKHITGSDEQLAERVLNWLDLAGKTPLIRPNTAPEVPLKKPTFIKKEKEQSENHIRATTVVKRPDSVKHITIIFNKEGIPIRYNRPIRYTDLFRIGLNATRRFASTLASAKLKKLDRKGVDLVAPPLPGYSAFDKASMDLKRTKGKSPSVKKNFENDYGTLINKKILEESCNLHEMRKQLHIFMPSLPKKTSPNPAADGNSSMVSAGAQSEQSKP